MQSTVNSASTLVYQKIYYFFISFLLRCRKINSIELSKIESWNTCIHMFLSDKIKKSKFVRENLYL